MAGANNAQMKAAGYRARDITKQRAEHGRLSHAVMEASGAKLKKGHERPAPAPRTSPPSGWQAAARGDGGDARRAQNAQRAAGEREKVLGAYRAKAADHDRAGDEGQRALRQGIRDQVKRTREAERQAWSERVVGPRNGYMPASEIQAAQAVKAERTKLAQMLQSRDAVARGRKQAATPGQGDLFGTPAPQRGPSPFQQRVAARREMLAAAGERAKGRQGGLRALAGTMMANRKVNAAANAAKQAKRRSMMVEGKTATEWSSEMTALQGKKPRPLNKLYRNPALITPAIKAKHDEQMRVWNRDYRRASKNQKTALEASNKAWREASPSERTALFGVR